ncbi:MAG TPA: C1 family peptidase, partial [Candidatus Binatia bacterium]
MSAVTLNGLCFDARLDRVDLRDLPYRPPLRSLPPRYPDHASIARYFQQYKKDRMILDQGQEGACTGFGLAAVINYLLWRDARVAGKKKSAPPKVSERMLYHLAKFYDEWPGEDYQGSSCRGAMKGWHRHGVCSAEYWPYRDAKGDDNFVKPREGWDHDAARRPLGVYYRIDKDSIVDMQSAIIEVGAIYVSAQVHDGWFGKLAMNRSLGLAVIKPLRDPAKTGGHAFAFVGYNEVGFIIQNSWGSGWGKDGFAVLPYGDWVNHGMDAWVAVMGAPVLGSSPHYQVPVSLKEFSSTSPEFSGLIPAGAARSPLENRNVPPWSIEDAYRHSIVTGNNGVVLNRDVTSNTALDYLQKVVYEKPLAWAQDPNKEYQLVFYAHGGVNDEQSSINRIRILAPYFLENGAYPIFFTWKTGFVESLRDIVGDE